MPTHASDDDFKLIDDHTKGKTKPPLNDEKMKKKRGSFSLFQAAVSIMRGKKGEKQVRKIPRVSSEPVINGNWKNLVESVRPLHLNEIDQSPPSSTIVRSESIEDFCTTPASPAPSSSGTMSQFASASSLQDLVDSDEEKDDPDMVFDAITGDDMIDAKAEEFIAQFYKQIQIQNTATNYHHRQRTIYRV